VLALLIATAETTTVAPAEDANLPDTWLGWAILAVIVGLYVVIQRTRRRHVVSRHDREVELRRADPDLRRED
jgi:hypothetical protein